MLLHECNQALTWCILDLENRFDLLEINLRFLPWPFLVISETILEVLIKLGVCKRSSHALEITVCFEERRNLDLVWEGLFSEFVSVKSRLDPPLVSFNGIVDLVVIVAHKRIVLFLQSLKLIFIRVLLEFYLAWVYIAGVYFQRFLTTFHLHCIYLPEVWLTFFS